MAKFRALMLWTDAWVADTKHLTRCERGTYHDLLVLMWRTPGCRVPNDDSWLAKRLDMTLDEIERELRPIIVEFCKTDGNWIWQKRLKHEREWSEAQAHSQSVKAKSRWQKEKDVCRGNASVTVPVTIDSLGSKEEPKAAHAASGNGKEGKGQPTKADEERDLYRRGKQVLGGSSGGQIKKLVRVKDGSVAQARATIEFASTKHDPREYVARVIHKLEERPQDDFKNFVAL